MQRLILVLVLLISLTLVYNCSEKEKPEVNKMEQMSDDAINSGGHNVEVEEKIDASTYSYLKVKENGNSYWIAVNQMDIKPGEFLFFTKSIEMQNFKSESLNKTFDKILFIDDARKSGSEEQLKAPHQNVTGNKDGSIKIEQVKGGYSVEQIYNQKSTLEFKSVKVRGKVVKVNNGIMGTNWVHIQDGTGKDGKHDLLVTTNQTIQVGSVIVAEGKVIKDKDFGSGYFYSVLLENSKITVE